MKKYRFLIIYLLGVLASLVMGSIVGPKARQLQCRPLTNRDVAFTLCISLTSWLSIPGWVGMYMVQLDRAGYWDKPVDL